MSKISITLDQLERLLINQKKVTADYITRNLSTYTFFKQHPEIDINLTKDELSKEVLKSGFPEDFNVLQKYLH